MTGPDALFEILCKWRNRRKTWRASFPKMRKTIKKAIQCRIFGDFSNSWTHLPVIKFGPKGCVNHSLLAQRTTQPPHQCWRNAQNSNLWSFLNPRCVFMHFRKILFFSKKNEFFRNFDVQGARLRLAPSLSPAAGEPAAHLENQETRRKRDYKFVEIRPI